VVGDNWQPVRNELLRMISEAREMLSDPTRTATIEAVRMLQGRGQAAQELLDLPARKIRQLKKGEKNSG